MTVSMTVTERGSVAGRSFVNSVTIAKDGALAKEVVLAVAKVGQLTTRTDNNTGTLTMAGGHGITTGARLDLYWEGGSQRGITVGTVSVNSVPFDLGVGDNLPSNLTAITAMVPQEEEFLLTGDGAGAIAVSSTRQGTVVFAQDDDTEILAVSLDGSSDAYVWHPGKGVANPLASVDVAKVFFSHGDSARTAEMKAWVMVD